MKLSAVTVCVNYSDYLEAVISNKQFFDEWVVVTCASDSKTQKLCSQNSVECLISSKINVDGLDFNAAYNKSATINEGIDRLQQNDWYLALDADVYLPRNFRARIEKLPLDCSSVYSALGRRVCETRAEFDAIREFEPWNHYCERQPDLYGYLHLFHSSCCFARYPETRHAWTGPHDDSVFTNQYKPSERRMLPFNVIHVGAPVANWHKRASAPFSLGSTKLSSPNQSLGQILSQIDLAGAVVAIIGCYPGRFNIALADCKLVYFIDSFSVFTPGGEPIKDADSEVLAKLWFEEVGRGSNFLYPGLNSRSSLEKVPEGCLDLLYFSDEITPDWFIQTYLEWSSKMKVGGKIGGEQFGFPTWPTSTHLISSMIGVPDWWDLTGAWFKKDTTEDSLRKYVPALGPAIDITFCWIFISREEAEVEQIILTILSLQSAGERNILVYRLNRTDFPLEIACAKLNVPVRTVGAGHSSVYGTRDDIRMELARVSGFKSNCFLEPGTILFGDPSSIKYSSVEHSDILVANPPLNITHDNGEQVCRYLIHCSAFMWRPNVANDQGILVSFEEPSLEWSEDACELRSAYEAELIRLSATRIRLPVSSSLCVVVDTSTLPDFERNWLSWSLEPSDELLLVLVGVSYDQIWCPTPVTCRLKYLEVAESECSDLVRRICGVVSSPYIVFASAKGAARPGADLFSGLGLDPQKVLIHVPDKAIVGSATALFACASREIMMAGEYRLNIKEGIDVEQEIGSFLRSLNVEIISVDISKHGWAHGY